MIRLLNKIIVGFIFLFFFFQLEGVAQLVTAGKDSTVIRRPGDTPVKDQEGWSKPGKAALFSAIIPGAGQVYNRDYWKVPIIYAAGAGLAYAIRFNHQEYQQYNKAVNVRTDRDKTNNIDRYSIRLAATDSTNAVRVLQRARDTHRRWRDYSIFYSLVAYGLNVAEAYVDAHLKGFNVNDELTLKVQPDILRMATTNTFTPVLTFSLNYRK
ncbi:DUF5683 domain-containing protein [Adhaeribacter aquaticus]|uniref:DUF5683 domain-containing protein n=1 Tax=Adhaeribacter aquaticus TaxID=299567 RepID=UPI0003F60454|nr:DUF5683 domain-containing protein [Adhaeribacter aquaticus]